MRRIVVVGGSIAAVTAADSLRANGFDGELVVLSEERRMPYSRVPLSKGVLAGTEAPKLAELSAPTTGIDFHTQTRATGLDPDRRTVALADGDELPYDALVIASGARARRLAGVGEFVVRTLEDVVALRECLTTAASAVVVGAGFLGMEVASTLRNCGLAVTVVDRDPPLRRLLGPWLAAVAVETARDHGLAFRVASGGVNLADMHTVRCDDTSLEADVVVSAVGDVPNVEWLGGTGLPISGGLVVDGCCRVAPGIVAAGDVTVRRTGDGTFTRSPHWTNAVEQGYAAASALLDGTEATPYIPDPYYWTEQFGLDIKISGHLPVSGVPEVVAGSIARRSALLRWRHAAGATVVALNHRLPIVKLKRLGARAVSSSPEPIRVSTS